MLKVIIVGGVAGGASAAARLRRLDETAQITVFERSGFVSYANCGLPYFIGGVITDESALTLQTPESFRGRFQVDIKVRHNVLSISPETKTVTVENLATGQVFQESYDKLILSPGAKPTLPPVSGLDLPHVFTLRTVEDTMAIHNFVEKNQPKSAILAGGGFIGVELAENLRDLGLEVTMVQRPKQLMNPLDLEMASFVHAKVRSHGIQLRLGVGVQEITDTGVTLANGDHLTADMVVLAIGVTPDTQLAKDAGLTLGIRDSIVVNEHMETSCPDIYAVGDAVQVKHYVTETDALISLAGPANKQGRIVADNICGIPSTFKGSMGSSVLKIFDMTMATTGINEKTALQLGLDVDKVYLAPANHAGYYPGGQAMTMKVLFKKESYKLLGAQIVGYDGVDKRIDVLATAIFAGMSALELKDLDLSYAPPYSSAKDPVNLAGFMIENIAAGNLHQFFLPEMDHLPKDGSVTCIDARTPAEYDRGHIHGFINIPVDKIRDHLAQLDKSKPVYVHCQTGLRSYIACRILAQHGFTAYNFSGGYRLWESVHLDKLAAEKIHPCGMDK